VSSSIKSVPSLPAAAPLQNEERKLGPPDLQELVRRFGGYNKILPEAWKQWDADYEQYYEKASALSIRGRHDSR
jgi:hypothetical protein